MNIVLTRESGKNELFRAWLPPQARVEEVPLTTTMYFDADNVRADLNGLSSLGTYRSLIVTSERSADYVEIALRAAAPDVELFVVGPTTKGALTDRGLRVHVEGEGSAETLAPRIARGPVLIVGAKVMRGELESALRAKGLEVDTLACYETLSVALDREHIATLSNADVIFIGAPSAWKVARAHVKDDAWVVVPGASTGSVVRVDHLKVIEGWGLHVRSRLDELAR